MTNRLLGLSCILCALAVFSCATPSSTADSTQSSAATTIYYVDDTSGDDSANGLSSSSALRSLAKVNSLVLNPGDSVLFKRGGVWHGSLKPVSGSSAGAVVYGAYGSGNKPLLLGSENRGTLSDWTSEGGSLWVSANTFAVDVGNMVYVDTLTTGTKKWSLAALSTSKDFYYDRTTHLVHVYSASNPAAGVTLGLECALRKHIVDEQGSSWVTYQDLDFRYGGAHGVGGGNTSHITVKNCNFSWIGGGDLNNDGMTRFGNGVEFWGNAAHNVVEDCTFDQIYDTALTNQNNGSVVQQTDLVYRRNHISNCGLASFEFWVQPAGSTVSNVSFEDNDCRSAGLGWGSQRPDHNGGHVVFYWNPASTTSISIQRNIFATTNDDSSASRNYPLALINVEQDWFSQLTMDNNTWYQATASQRLAIFFTGSAVLVQQYLFNQSAAYQAYSHQDTNSTFPTAAP